ncbi:ribonuclease kappa [Anaeramoeba flamelloides]|uniref:Ribonuclease kappa n=1 Tax=Anaeramoeba flamelloides TaxID=1746091 RepID=A0AAV7Y8I0_9EUKA|nr:ribonuclease kappa [Anaeramoeba flamelloides]KAJ6232896.1 ribonuclease kappa [Anaeramoeba flamelloides]
MGNSCIPEKKGSIFCIILSIWGVIMLVILGILFSTGHQGNIGDIGDKKPKSLARDLYIAAGIYLVFLIGCSFRYKQVTRRERYKELVVNNEEFDEFAIN